MPLSLIQVSILAFAAFGVLAALARHRSGHLARPRLLLWVLFWAGAGTLALVPDSTTRLAGIFGVGRGVDLVFYASLLALFYLQFKNYVRMEELERDITRLVRQQALTDGPAAAKDAPSPDSGRGSWARPSSG